MADDPTVNIDLDRLSNEALQQRIELLREKNDLEREAVSGAQATYDKATERNEETIKQIEREIAALERKKRTSEGLTAAQEEQLQKGRAEVKAIEQQNRSHASSVQAIKKHEAALEELNKDGENFTNVLLGTNNQLGNFISKMVGTKGGLKAFGKGLLGLLNPFKLLMSFLSKVIQQSILFGVAVDKARASFVKATGASGKFEGEIVGLAHAMKGTGVRADEVAKAYGSLYTGMQDFTKISAKERAGLTKTVSLFQELGVSADTQSEILNEATRSLGYNVDELEGVLLMVGGVADGLNEPINKVMENFKTVSQKLAFYGKNIEGVFKNLSAQSKATGLSIDQLLGVVEQFDTFEGAGKAVGKLNAIMGGPYLNSIDMLNAKEDERVEILQRSMKQSGMNFKQMGKYEQKMIASSLGVSASEARKLFGAETETDKMEAMQAAKLAARQSRSQDIEEKMLSLMESFAYPIQNIIEKLKTAMDAVGAEVRNLLRWFEGLTSGDKAKVLLGSIIGTFVISKFPKWLLSKAAPGGGGGGMWSYGSRMKPPKGSWYDHRIKGFRGAGGQAVGGRPSGFKPTMGQRLMGRMRTMTGRTGRFFSKPGTGGGRIGRALTGAKQAFAGSRVGGALAGAKAGISGLMTSLSAIRVPGPLMTLVSKIGTLGTGFGAVTSGAARFGASILKFLYPLELLVRSVMALVSNFNLFGKSMEDGESISEKFFGLMFSFFGSLSEAAGRATDGLIDLINLFLPKNWEIPELNLGDTIHDALQSIDFGFINETFGYMAELMMQSLASLMPARMAKLFGLEEYLESEVGGGTGGQVRYMGEWMSQKAAQSLMKEAGVDDFIYRGKGELGPGTITPINSKDQFMGLKPGGDIDRLIAAFKGSTATATTGTGGKPIVINVHIGQRKIDQIVVDALNSPTGRKFLSPYAE